MLQKKKKKKKKNPAGDPINDAAQHHTSKTAMILVAS
jgi:hypothetical protein